MNIDIRGQLMATRDLRKECFWLVLTSVLVTMALRWPSTYHETGVDSLYIHSLSTSIVQFGDMGWIASPLSIFGLYPLSYSSGIPILLSQFALMTGTTVEFTILIFSFLVAAIAAMTSFMLTLEIRKSPILAFAVSIIYSASPFLLFYTQWTMTTRSFFMALIPLTIWLIIKRERLGDDESDRRMKTVLLVLLAANLVILVAIHKVALMALLFIVSYLIARRVHQTLNWGAFHKGFRFVGIQFPQGRLLTIVMIIGVGISVTVLSYYLGWLGLESYELGIFSDGSDLSKLLNVMGSVAATAGLPIALLFPIGFAIIVLRKKKSFVDLFLVISLLILLPFLGSRTYERLLFPIVIVIMIFIPIHFIKNKRHRKIFTLVIAVAVILTLPFNFVIVDRYNQWPSRMAINDGIAITDHTYMTALYFQYNFEGENFAINNDLIGGGVQATSGGPQFPLGILSAGISNLLVYGIITPNELDVETSSLESMLASKGQIFSTHWTLEMINDWVTLYLICRNMKDASNILDKYNVTVFIEDKRLNGKVVDYDGNTLWPHSGSSQFIVGVHKETYIIYDNGVEMIWVVR
jgi:hypothetical protein